MKHTTVSTQWGKSRLTIDDQGLGVIDLAAKFAFTRGQCHALAVVIKQKTGWKVLAVGDEPDSPAHCVVEVPHLGDRRYLDIEGLHTLDELDAEFSFAEYDEYGLVVNDDVTVDEMLAPFRGYLPPNIKAAEPFAKTVLLQVNPVLRQNGAKEVEV